jgi:hypothetical protein
VTTDLRPRRYEDDDREPQPRLITYGPDDPYADDASDDQYEEDTPAASAPEREVTGELVQGELAGRTIYVPPTKKWRASALHALREGDFDTWAQTTLADDDWDIWIDVDPTLEQVEAFFASVNKGLGTSPGNSRASRRSARSTRRR